ncbi:response regulator transcription factor [Pigmentiphaga sp.]|uniref:response regulator transcription factor n=1 Tax=Pigmentiphaga sp. TaxID=1977564 RepID=UPI00128E7404|nr:response regulator transcription factor [Pigmentiphaga sp.]MPS30212.1 response regulator transcription factor [Alcaligenaceae bacterium SAGV5]MPS55075.1 response regulator transcription factor [Alcaligenaceae bacterium SAGV3]MPT55323.1 response regulator transcription factor [Alcaligenaceae bacterium]
MTTPHPRVLIVEDDMTISANLCAYFEAKGYVVDVAYDGPSALYRLGAGCFDAVLLDIGLPGIDGVTVLHRLRAELHQATPVLLLTARDELQQKLDAFGHGADDYVTKPYALAEVEARVRALLNRASGQVANPVRRFGELSYDARTREVRVMERPVRLTPKASRIVEVLIRDPGRVVSRADLESALWGSDVPEKDALRSQIHLLRKALSEAGFDGLETVHGVGYRLSGGPGRD